MDLSILPDTDDEYIGYAILMLMFFFMFVWITSGASPINFPQRAQIGVLVGHVEVILVVLIPIVLLGLIESLYGKPETQSTKIAQKYVSKLQALRARRTGHFGKYQKPKPKEDHNA